MSTTDQAARRAAHHRLDQALLQLAATGGRVLCDEPDAHRLWFSELPTEQREAARRCRGCPVRQPCADAGATERWGIWGGRPAGRRGAAQDEEAAA